MCGIAGFFQTKYNISNEQTYYFLKNKLEKMKNAIKHRGPDDDDIYLSGFLNNNGFSDKTEFPNNIIGGFVGFAHSRLSIRDIKGGHQPMTRAYKNHKATIVYNGEIYNTDYLRKMLSSFNISFETTGDTEIILYCYLVFGTDIFKELNGIFSFVIYDNDTAIVVRDHIGVKPLFYFHNNREFVFSSEPKGIFAYGIKPMINSDSWCEIIGLGPAHTLGNGVFKNIKEVLPGHYLTVTTDYHHNVKVKDLCYWKLKAKPHIDDYNTTVDKCSYLITDSIQKQMVSDIPICTFLSGGLDSSVISSVAFDKFKKDGLGVLNSFSIDYKDNEKYFKKNLYEPNSDPEYVKRMVEFLGSNHHNIVLNNIDLARALDDATKAADLPGMADVDSSLYLFAKEVRKYATVALSGECADEVFGGYPWFTREYDSIEIFPWANSIEYRKNILKPSLKDLPIEEYVKQTCRDSINKIDKLPKESHDDRIIRELTYLNIKYQMLTLINRKDRMTMSNSLEGRVPYADKRLVQYAFNFPKDIKLLHGREKGLLREAVRGIVPDEIIDRKKSPYPKTHNPEYTREVSNMLKKILEDRSSPIHQIIDYDFVSNIVDTGGESFKEPWYGQLMTGPQVIAYLIQLNNWMKFYNVKLDI